MDQPTTSTNTSTIPILCSLCTHQLFTPSVFGHAWRNLLSNFRSRLQYLTSWSNISSASALGCVWCELLRSLREPRDDNAGKRIISVEVRLRKDANDGSGKARPKGTESLSVWIDGTPRASWYVYASPGMTYYASLLLRLRDAMGNWLTIAILWGLGVKR